MKLKITLLTLIINFCYSQNDFKPCVYETINGEKISGFTNDLNLYDNNYLSFKTALLENEIEIPLTKIKKILIENNKEFIVEDVEMIDYKEAPEDPYGYKNLTYTKKRLILKKLVEGKISLYLTEISSIFHYFITEKNGGKVINLINYEYEEYGKTKIYSVYKTQLLANLNCNENRNFDKTPFTKKALINEIILNNQCNGDTVKDLSNQDKKNEIQVFVVGGIKSINFDINSRTFYPTKDIKNNSIVPYLGIEAILQVKKYDFFLRANVDKTQFSITEQVDFQNEKRYNKVEQSLTIVNANIGIRYNFIRKKSYKIFTDLSLETNGVLNSNINISTSIDNINDKTKNELKPNNTLTYNLGVGIKFKNKYGVEIRYSYLKNYFQNYYYIDSKVTSLNLNLFHKLF